MLKLINNDNVFINAVPNLNQFSFQKTLSDLVGYNLNMPLRILQACLPILNVNERMAKVFLLGETSSRFSRKISFISISYSNNTPISLLDGSYTALCVIGFMGRFFNYRVTLIAHVAQNIVSDVINFNKMQNQNKNKNNPAVVSTLAFKTAKDCLYLATLLVPNPYLLLISTVAHTALQTQDSYKKIRDGDYIEGVAGFVLSGINAYQCHKAFVKISIPFIPLLKFSFKF